MGSISWRSVLRLVAMGARHGREELSGLRPAMRSHRAGRVGEVVRAGRASRADCENALITQELVHGDPTSLTRYRRLDHPEKTALKMTFALIGIGVLIGVVIAAAGERSASPAGGGAGFPPER